MAKLLNKFLKDFGEITDYYNYLIRKTKNHEYVDITNEWLIDNYYVLAEHKNGIVANKKKINKYSKIINKNYYLLKNIVVFSWWIKKVSEGIQEIFILSRIRIYYSYFDIYLYWTFK